MAFDYMKEHKSDNVGMHRGASENAAVSENTAAFKKLIASENLVVFEKSKLSESPPLSHPKNSSDIISSNFPVRKNIRAEFHDYSGGEYFITICTRDKEHYLGEIQNNVMQFSEIGAFADKQLQELHSHYKYVEVPLFVVMPNHIHAIINIFEPADAPGCIPTMRTALSVVVGGFKQAVTMYARRNNIEFGWQKRFHDHIIRGVRDGNMISDYIRNNVSNWKNDCFYLECED